VNLQLGEWNDGAAFRPVPDSLLLSCVVVVASRRVVVIQLPPFTLVRLLTVLSATSVVTYNILLNVPSRYFGHKTT